MVGKKNYYIISTTDKKRLAAFLRRPVLRSLPCDTTVTETTIEFFPRPANEISSHLNVIPNEYFSGDENHCAG